MRIISVILLVLCLMAVASSVSSGALSDSKAIFIDLINQDPDPAIVGDVAEIYLGIENIGGESVNDLIVELEVEYPFTLVQGESAIRKISTINAYQKDDNMKIISYKIKVDDNAAAGSYDLTIRYYEQGGTFTKEDSVTIDVKGRIMAEIIQIDKTSLVPGKQTGLKFTINNVGNAPLKDLTFSWVNDDKIILPVGSDNTKYINYIDIGDSIELEYQVLADPNAIPGLYELKLYLTYVDSITGEENEVATIAGVNVGGGTDFDVTFSESSYTGTSFTVANIGSNPAYSVSVIVPKQSEWQVSGSNSMIIGNLNKGDYTIASFNLISTEQTSVLQDQNVDGDDAKEPISRRSDMQESNGLKIQIAYTDTVGEREIIEKIVSISPQSISSDTATGVTGKRGIPQDDGVSSSTWYIIGFVVLILGVVFYRKYQQRKLVDPQFTIRDFFQKAK